MKLYAVTGDAFARLEEGAATFALEGSGAQCLARDPARAETVYVGARGTGVWKSEDAGGTWRKLDFPHPDVFSLAVSAADGAVYAGCEPSMLFVSRDGRLRGSHFDLITNTTVDIQGNVDGKSGQASWTIGPAGQVIFQTNLEQLTSRAGNVTARYPDGQTDQWQISRLEN